MVATGWVAVAVVKKASVCVTTEFAANGIIRPREAKIHYVPTERMRKFKSV